MDNINRILTLAVQSRDNNDKYFNEAYIILDNLISQRNINDPSEAATEMCIVLAESALKHNNYEIPNKCIKLYFSLDPPKDQYLARAYIVQAQLIHPKRFDDDESLEKPMAYILKAIKFAKKEQRYHYLVFNCSVVFYQIVRNFMRSGFFQFIVKALSQVSKALDEVNDSNMAWRSQMQYYLLQALIDSGRKKEAIQAVDSTVTFIGKHAPHLLKDVLNILVMNNIGNNDKYLYYTRNSPAMQVYLRICRFRQMKDKDGESTINQEARKVYNYMTGNEEPSLNKEADKEDSKGSTAVASLPLNIRKLNNEQRCALLLELAKVCFQKSALQVARQCIDRIRNIAAEEMMMIMLEVDFLECDMSLFEADNTGLKMTSNAVRMRLRSIEKCRLTLDAVLRFQRAPPSSLINASSSNKPGTSHVGFNALLEYGCGTMWNLCMPLLHCQPFYRDKVHPQLVKAAHILENINSLQFQMCCQINIEIGRGYAQLEQSMNALKHFKLALSLDRTGEYHELISQLSKATELREKLYSVPEDPVDRAVQLLEQVRSSVQDQGQMVRPVLTQIGLCLAPDDFQHLLDRDIINQGQHQASASSNTTDSTPLHVISSRSEKLATWSSAIQRLNTFLRRSGNMNDRAKMAIWLGLIKVARQANIWDICRVASCFAILYDDGRWKNEFKTKSDSAASTKKEGRSTVASKTESTVDEQSRTDEKPEDPKEEESDEEEETESSENDSKLASRYEKWLLESLCDVYFIRAESYIEVLRAEGAQLYTFPTRPVDLKKRPKGFVKDTESEDKAWMQYCAQLKAMSDMVVGCYERVSEHAVSLEAPWLVHNSAVYLWNYSAAVLNLGEHHVLVPGYQVIYENMRQLLTPNLVENFVQLGSVLAHGLIQRHMPQLRFSIKGLLGLSDTNDVGQSEKKDAKKSREKSPKQKTNTANNTSQSPNPTEIAASNKKALEITQFLMELTTKPTPAQPTNQQSQAATTNQNSTESNSSNQTSSTNKNSLFLKTVSIATKYRLLEIWCMTKQLQHQPIPKSMFQDDPDMRIGQIQFVKSILATQIVWINLNDVYKFPDSPSIQDCIQLFDTAEFLTSTNTKSNNIPKLAMEILIRLCLVAMETSAASPSAHSNSKLMITDLSERAHKILDVIKVDSNTSNPTSKASSRTNQKSTEKYLVTLVKQGIAFIDLCLGVCAYREAENQLPGILNSMQMLVYAIQCAKESDNYNLVSVGSHYIWGVCKTVMRLTNSTSLVTESLDCVVKCLTSCMDKRRLKLFFESHGEEEKLKIENELLERLPCEIQTPDTHKMITITSAKSIFSTIYRKKFMKSALEQDIKLRVKMVTAVYKSYIEHEHYKQALELLENALFELPRTNHRMELFKLRIFTKIRLGQNIDMDIQKFRNEPEIELAKLWRDVAINSIKEDAQLTAYKMAVQSIKNPENNTLKAEILLELVQWLYNQDYPLKNLETMLNWSVDLLLNLKLPSNRDTKPVETKPRNNQRSLKGSGRTVGSGVSSKKSALSNNAGKTASVSIVDNKKAEPAIQLDDVSEIVGEQNQASVLIGSKLQPDRPACLSDITNVGQLSVLFKCFVYCSTILGGESIDVKRNYLLLAAACIDQIWKTSMSHVSSSLKEISRAKSDSDTPSKGSKDKKDKKEKASKPETDTQTKSKVIKRKGPVDWLPTTFHEWSLFEVTDEIVEVLSSKEFMGNTGFNSGSIPNMSVFIVCCDEFLDQLEQLDLDPISFPTISFLDAVSRSDESICAHVRNQCVHLRALKIAQKLGISQAISHHEDFIDHIVPSPESINFVSCLKNQTITLSDTHPNLNLPPAPINKSLPSATSVHLSRVNTKHDHLHSSWLHIAQILCDLGYHGEADANLREAEILAIYYSDTKVQIDCQLTRARLAVHQGEIETAIHIMDSVEETFSTFTMNQWKQFLKILLDIGLYFANSLGDVAKIKTRLERFESHTKNMLKQMKLTNQNAEVILLDNLFKEANISINIKLFELNMSELNTVSQEVIDEVIQTYSRFRQMMDVYRMVDLKLKTDFDAKLSSDLLSRGAQKRILLEKAEFLQRIIQSFEMHLEQITDECGLKMSSNLSLPTQRELAKLKLTLSECLITMLEIETNKMVKRAVAKRQKSVIEQMIDEYVEVDGETFTNDDKEEEEDNESIRNAWRYLQLRIHDDIITLLEDVHSLANGVSYIQAEVLFNQAKVLYLKSKLLNPHDEDQWKLANQIKQEPDAEETLPEGETEDTRKESEQISVSDKVRRLAKWEKLQHNNTLAKQYLLQANEILYQTISLSLHDQQYELASNCCELLLDSLGQSENCQPGIQVLTLLQSCRTAISLRNLLISSVRKASLGRLGALLMQKLQLDLTVSRMVLNTTSSTIYKVIMEKLNTEFIAWKVCSVNPNPHEMLKELSSIACSFCVIQTSSNKDKVYCAYIDGKHKSGTQGGKGAHKNVPDHNYLTRIGVSKAELTALLKDWGEFRCSMDDAVFKIENKLTLVRKQAAIVAQSDDPNEMRKEQASRAQLQSQVDSVLEDWTKYYSALCDTTDNMFVDMTTELNMTRQQGKGLIHEDTIHKPPKASPNLAASTSATMTTKKESLVLLCDPELSGVVFESLESFKDVVSRDFSLQTIYYRFKVHGTVMGDADQNASSAELGTSAAAGDKKKDKGKLPHRIPALRDGGSKKPGATGGKQAALNRQIPAHGLNIDTNQYRYIVDPCSDTTGSMEIHPGNSGPVCNSLVSYIRFELGQESPNELLATREAQITGKWIGIGGEDNVEYMDSPVPTQVVELYLKDAHAVEYVNTESLASLMTPQRLAMLNTNDLKLLCMFDRSWTRQTKKRFLSTKSLKKEVDLANLDSSNTALLVTLMGCRSFVNTEWAQLLSWITDRVTRFHKNFLDNGLSLDESINDLRSIPNHTTGSESLQIPTDESATPNVPLVVSRNILADQALLVYGLPNVYLGSPA